MILIGHNKLLFSAWLYIKPTRHFIKTQLSLAYSKLAADQTETKVLKKVDFLKTILSQVCSLKGFRVNTKSDNRIDCVDGSDESGILIGEKIN